MTLSKSLLKEFARVTANPDRNRSKQSTVYGTIVTSNNENFVRIDGSDIETPVSMASGANNGDRVVVMIKDHKAVVTGNTSTPPSSIDVSNYVKRTDILPITFSEIDEIIDGA